MSRKSNNSKIITSLTILFPMLIAILTVGSSIYKDYTDTHLSDVKLKLEMFKVKRETLKDGIESLEKHSQLLSDLQIAVVNARKYCIKYKPTSKDPKEFKAFKEKLSKLEEIRNRVSDQLFKSFVLIEFFYGKVAHDKAKFFVHKTKVFSNPCSKDFPREDEWIKWQNDAVSALIHGFKRNYKTVFLCKEAPGAIDHR